jgi:hypothetical protein
MRFGLPRLCALTSFITSSQPSFLHNKHRIPVMSTFSASLSSSAGSNVDGSNGLVNPSEFLATDPIRSTLYDIYCAQGPARNVFSVATAGIGGSLASWMFSTFGGSNSIMAFDIPYSRSAVEAYMSTPFANNKQSDSKQYPCTVQTAVELSKTAFRKTVELFIKEEKDLTTFARHNNFGIGSTAALVSSEVGLLVI